MWPDRHLNITAEALRGEGLNEDTRKFIGRANWDSDVHGYNNNEQHYCRDPFQSSAVAITKSLAFKNNAIECATRYVREGHRKRDSKDLTTGLYFLGRAFHCLQDFYAHSNWVMLENHAVWNEVRQECIKVCEATPSDRKYDNKPTYSPQNKSKQQSFEDIRNPNLPMVHPDMQLDYSGSWACRVYQWCTPSWKRGYKCAADLAVTHTKNEWQDFLNGLGGQGAVEELKSFHVDLPGIGKRVDRWNAWRGQFENDMPW